MKATLPSLRFTLRSLLVVMVFVAMACTRLAVERRAVLARQEFRASAGKGMRVVSAADFAAKRGVACSWEKNVVPQADTVDVATVPLIRRLLGDEAIQAIFVPSASNLDQTAQAELLFPEAQIVGQPNRR